MTLISQRWRATLAIGALALGLAGCGAAETTPAASSGAPAAQATAAPTTAPTSAPATAAPAAAPTEAATAAPTMDMSMPGHDMSTMPDMGGEKVEARIQTFVFKPEPLEVKVGTTITWTNNDAIEHSVTHGTAPTPGGAFDSDFFVQGETFSFTFSEAGEFPYFCKRHPSMVGTVKVTQ